jgi:ABC-type multidrug transport system ATPase subunit
MDLSQLACLRGASLSNGDLQITMEGIVLARGVIYLEGANGSGKTTLIRGLLGRLSLQGDRILHYDTNDIGYVPQDYRSCLFPWMSAYQNLTMFCNGNEVDRVLKLASRIGFDSGALERRVFTLSGGQCQRVALAREIALCPGVLFADEPFASLDVRSIEQVANDLRDYVQGGGSVVMTSHVPLPAVLGQIAQHIVIERKQNSAYVRTARN